ncbi:MAG TPA: CBS domain-containing protein [Firmicutes bacterium]|nr:CBS domain-containing protein [Bacillota bacterium]
MKISDIMTANVISISKDESVAAAARLLRRYNVGALPVTDRDMRLRGIVTDRDIATRCVAADADPKTTKVGEIMSRGIITASPGDTVGSAVRSMSSDQVRRLPVIDDGRVVGMVTLCDMARARSCEMEAAEALAEISTNIRRR